MKLYAANYISPIETEGTFTDVYVEDVETRIINDGLFYIAFEMYYNRNNQRISLGIHVLPFQGRNDDSDGSPTTNRTAYAKLIASGEEFPLLEVLAANNGELPGTYEISNFGYPNAEDAAMYFGGGSIGNSRITILNPLAIGFVLDTILMKGEKVGVQFQFLE